MMHKMQFYNPILVNSEHTLVTPGVYLGMYMYPISIPLLYFGVIFYVGILEIEVKSTAAIDFSLLLQK